jgi:hypothetical protein
MVGAGLDWLDNMIRMWEISFTAGNANQRFGRAGTPALAGDWNRGAVRLAKPWVDLRFEVNPRSISGL